MYARIVAIIFTHILSSFFFIYHNKRIYVDLKNFTFYQTKQFIHNPLMVKIEEVYLVKTI
jgi:hypothetical protein